MINLSTQDLNALVSEEQLISELQTNTDMLKQAQSGESCYSDSLGWLDVDEWANSDIIQNIENIAMQIRSSCDAFVLIGVGGSNNAARSVIEALKDGSSPEIIYAGNTLSPSALKNTLSAIKGKKIAINCIAKNFETLEPGISFRVLRQEIEKSCTPEQAAERIICTGSFGSSLEQLCIDNGYTFIPFPDNIGGRYSAISYVGLLPMAVAGIDIRTLVNGAKEMQQVLRTSDAQDNVALRYAVLRSLYYKKGYKLELLSSFEPQLKWFYKWWIQLFAESEGKDGKGLFPICAEYSEELHAVGQYVQDGAPLMFETFLNVENPLDSLIVLADDKKDYFDYLDGKDFYDINKAAFKATVLAHSKKLPCVILNIPTLDAYTFGQLFYFFQFSCYLSGKLIGINPFDQPGVEAYKKWMFNALGK